MKRKDKIYVCLCARIYNNNKKTSQCLLSPVEKSMRRCVSVYICYIYIYFTHTFCRFRCTTEAVVESTK